MFCIERRRLCPRPRPETFRGLGTTHSEIENSLFNGKLRLYSSIFENDDDEKILEFMKPKKHTHQMNRGGWKTTAQGIGQYSHEANLNGIKFGRLNKMKDTYDHGHL